MKTKFFEDNSAFIAELLGAQARAQVLTMDTLRQVDGKCQAGILGWLSAMHSEGIKTDDLDCLPVYHDKRSFRRETDSPHNHHISHVPCRTAQRGRKVDVLVCLTVYIQHVAANRFLEFHQ